LIQSGEHVTTLLSSPARFRDDGVEKDILSDLSNFLGGAVDALFFGALSEWKNVLLMNQHTATNYKFLIMKDSTYNSNNLVKKDYSNTFTGGSISAYESATEDSSTIQNVPADKRFNYPLWFYEGRLRNLYSVFHVIKDPRLPGQQNFNFKFEFAFNCEELQNFSFDKTVRLRKNGVQLQGTVRELTVNYTNRTMIVEGIV
jgi:hypothetical protein